MSSNWISAEPGFSLVGWCGQEFDEPIVAWRISARDMTEKDELSAYSVEPLTVTGYLYAGRDKATIALRWPDGTVEFETERYVSVADWRASGAWRDAVQKNQDKFRERRGF
ncbi:hypothetical protein [Methyloligella solikamskensis]|uniref:ASPIC/UnbV domain-containing protein n=1 Tax=Methyloligella solikamskensis TaxID=1177756 RepID=A0ABW3JEE6_9HYPH